MTALNTMLKFCIINRRGASVMLGSERLAVKLRSKIKIR